MFSEELENQLLLENSKEFIINIIEKYYDSIV